MSWLEDRLEILNLIASYSHAADRLDPEAYADCFTEDGAFVGRVGGRPHSASYSASKFALVGYSETLYVHFMPKGIGVSVLCPGGVRTPLPDNVRLSAAAKSPEGYGLGEAFGPEAVEPEAVAEMVLDAVEHRRFLVLTDPRQQKMLERRVADMQGWVENRARAAGQG